MESAEPFMLYISKRFMDKASKAFNLGLITRKPLVKILEKMNVDFREISREEARGSLERIGSSKGATVSTGQVVKNLALAFFLPTGVFYAALKKVHYISGAETDDSIMMEFLAEIPRAFRPTLFYYIWLFVPKTGGENTKKLIREIVERTGVSPLNEEEWENVRPIVEKLAGRIEARGVAENLWESLLKDIGGK